ncbi:hypothetical protein [Actomonas aquatica]|uniref:Ig-like domain-containing protein n=1 Tax=Actomonas aquatica TaxID=2866162 RepID=A0ABZ1CBY4_9BACT|nr:hypothetical protein [Opitutus sp. WL0086]WRQ89188.1 hypothetical protein K1X11_007195 [Opitutus sp. WL0086]
MNSPASRSLLRRLSLVLALGLTLSTHAQTLRFAETPFGTSTFSGGAFKVAPGSDVSLDIDPTSLPPEATVQWFHDATPIPGATATALDLVNLSSADTGNYRVQLTTPLGTSWSRDTLTINVQPLPPSGIDPSFQGNLLPDELRTSQHYSQGFLSDGRPIVAYETASTRRLAVLGLDGSLLHYFDCPSTNGPLLTTTADDRLVFAQAPYLRSSTGEPLDFTLPETLDPTLPLDQALPLADGKLLLRQQNTVLRCLADGTSDPTFTPIVWSNADIRACSVDTLRRLYVWGNATRPHDRWIDELEKSEWCTRYTTDGSIDPSFTGIQADSIYDFKEWDFALHVTPLTDGRILVQQSEGSGANYFQLHSASGELIAGSTTDRLVCLFPPQVDVSRDYLYLFDEQLRRYSITATGLTLKTDAYFGLIEETWRYQFHALAPTGELYTHTPADVNKGFVRLRQDLTPPTSLAPKANAYVAPWDYSAGDTATLAPSTPAADSESYEWIALDGQPLDTAAAAQHTLIMANVSAAQLGRYQLRVTNAYGSTLSPVVALTATDRPTALANLSGRAVPGSGDDVLIVGFSARRQAGTGPWFMFRGVGPGLIPHGITHPVADPALLLFDSTGDEIGDNDSWDETTNMRDRFDVLASRVGAFTLQAGSGDAALERTLPGATPFSLQLVNRGATTGPGLLEIYETTDEPHGLQNLSFRARTGPGDAAATAGFVVRDPAGFDRPARLLLRAVGPGLTAFNVNNTLTAPRLVLRDASGTVIRAAATWHEEADAAQIAYATPQVGAFPLAEDATDAAMLVELPPGVFTMAVESADSSQTSGIVLLEIYLLP